MTDTERSILQTLVELDEKVKSMPTANPKPNLLPVFDRLDQLTRQLPTKTSAPELLHYLHKKSYLKARLFLEGRDAEHDRQLRPASMIPRRLQFRGGCEFYVCPTEKFLTSDNI